MDRKRSKSQSSCPDVWRDGTRKRIASSSSDSSDDERRKYKRSLSDSTVKKKRKKRISSSSSSSSTSSSSSSSDSDSASHSKRKRKSKKKKQKRKEKKEMKKLKRKLKKLKKNKKEKLKPREESSVPSQTIINTEKKVLTPMTKEEWEKKQSEIRRVFDAETGRSRLVRGEGEVVEEIVSRERQKEINKQATLSDGISFQKQTGMWR